MYSRTDSRGVGSAKLWPAPPHSQTAFIKAFIRTHRSAFCLTEYLMLQESFSDRTRKRMSALTIQRSPGRSGECNKAGKEPKGIHTGKEKQNCLYLQVTWLLLKKSQGMYPKLLELITEFGNAPGCHQINI